MKQNNRPAIVERRSRVPRAAAQPGRGTSLMIRRRQSVRCCLQVRSDQISCPCLAAEMVFVVWSCTNYPLEEAATTETVGEASLMGIMETREAIAETADNSKLQEMWKNNEKPYLGKHLG
jgi:hypothetical protein